MCFFFQFWCIQELQFIVCQKVIPLFIFWITFLLDLELNCKGKLMMFRRKLIVLLLLQVFFVMKEISLSLSYGKIRLTLLRLSVSLLDNLRIKLTIFTLTKWRTVYTLLNSNSIKPILPIPKHLSLDVILCISNGTVSTKMYDKRDDFDFDIVKFPFLDGDVPGVPHMGYIYEIRQSFFKS